MSTAPVLKALVRSGRLTADTVLTVTATGNGTPMAHHGACRPSGRAASVTEVTEILEAGGALHRCVQEAAGLSLTEAAALFAVLDFQRPAHASEALNLDGWVYQFPWAVPADLQAVCTDDVARARAALAEFTARADVRLAYAKILRSAAADRLRLRKVAVDLPVPARHDLPRTPADADAILEHHRTGPHVWQLSGGGQHLAHLFCERLRERSSSLVRVPYVLAGVRPSVVVCVDDGFTGREVIDAFRMAGGDTSLVAGLVRATRAS